jgi:N-acetylmuramoyl-L-alanine amidase
MGERELGTGEPAKPHRRPAAPAQQHEGTSLTRRALLGGAAAAGAASLVRPGLAEAILRRQTIATRSLGTLAGASAPILAPFRFALVGIEWSGPRAAHIELRARAPNRGWSPWAPASLVGHDGDGQGDSQAASLFGEPVWTGAAYRVQLRSDRRVRDLRIHFVAARVSSAARFAAAPPLAMPALETGPGQPPIIARKAWAAGQAHPATGPFYGTVKLAFVHHTVNPNGYSAGAVPSMLRAIFDYHVHVRGFFDIAYNFIIDAYGRIWEARAGGIDMAVVGAHAGAYNAQSTGVAMLGDFMNRVPSPAAISALQHLVAWKLSLHGLPANGRAHVVVDPATAFYTPFRPGAHITLPRVAGHRDGDSTDCPGNALYARLPAIRPTIVSLAGVPARLTAAASPARVTAGTTVSLSGSLGLLTGAPLGGAPVELQSLGPAATTFAAKTTSGDGSWSGSITPQQNTAVRALHRPYPASVSDWIEVEVAPVITLSAQSGGAVLVSGTISPAKRRVRLDLYRAGGPRRSPLRTKRVGVAGGQFSARFTPPPGSYVVVARTAADALNAAGVSPPVPVTVP